ncbi:MAG: GNAT family N-acetyltransferase [Sedimentisphaerales bacterium]
MRHADIRLIEPTVELKSEFLEMAEEYNAEGEKVINGIGSIDKDDFENSVGRLKDHAKGVGLPEGWVPASTYWLISRGRIVGTCNLRHRLNDFLKNLGGHIGYSVRPSERQKGYATKMLSLVLEKARALGITRILITCDDNNIASARVIEKNGGKLVDKTKREGSKELIRRYWIDLNGNKNENF